MGYQTTIVGRKGHMEDREHVTDEVMARCTDDQGHSVWAGGVTDDEAKANAVQVMDRLLADEQAYQDAIASDPDPEKQRQALLAVQVDSLRREVRRLGGKP